MRVTAWTRRVAAGAAVGAIVVLLSAGTAGAAGSTPSGCVIPQTMDEPTCVVAPVVVASSNSPSLPFTGTTPATGPAVTPAAATPPSASPTSLPFTGADVEELAVVGVGAVLAGTLLLRRRRRTT
jgi:LPXTG-motif cell wall-anchored protein